MDTHNPRGHDCAAVLAAASGRRARITYFMHQAVILGGLLGGGMSLGYYAGVQSTREDASAEIERLQRTHQAVLDVISGRQVRTAERLEATASTVSEVATTVSEVASTAAAASETAQAAATTAGKAAKAAGVPAASIEQDRKAINNAIGKANARIGEGAR